jgi:hypothetical protein
MKRIGIVVLVLAGFVGGVAFVYSCGGGSSASGEAASILFSGSYTMPVNDGFLGDIYPFVFDISDLGDGILPEDVNVVVSGMKTSDSDDPEMAVMFRSVVTDTPYPLTLTIYVWDMNGAECGVVAPIPAAWLNKKLELTFVASY